MGFESAGGGERVNEKAIKVTSAIALISNRFSIAPSIMDAMGKRNGVFTPPRIEHSFRLSDGNKN